MGVHLDQSLGYAGAGFALGATIFRRLASIDFRTRGVLPDLWLDLKGCLQFRADGQCPGSGAELDLAMGNDFIFRQLGLVARNQRQPVE